VTNALRQTTAGTQTSTPNGELDLSTARELRDSPAIRARESAAIEIMNARAETPSGQARSASAPTYIKAAGWQIFVNRCNGQRLPVYVRGGAPRYPAGTGDRSYPVTETITDLPNVRASGHPWFRSVTSRPISCGDRGRHGGARPPSAILVRSLCPLQVG